MALQNASLMLENGNNKFEDVRQRIDLFYKINIYISKYKVAIGSILKMT